MTSRQPIGGMEGREMLPSMLLFVTPVRESSSRINDLLDCCSPCEYLSGSRKRLLWILSWDCLGLSLDMIFLWVIMNRLTKVAHCVPVKTTYTGLQLAKLYRSRIVYLHGVSKRIVSTKGT
jgi:hypothetical protein